MRKEFPHARLELIHNEHYYLVINHKKGGSFRLITKEGSYADAGALTEVRDKSPSPVVMFFFKMLNLLFGSFRVFRKTLRAYLRKKLVSHNFKYHPRHFEISEDKIIVKGISGTKASYTNNQSSRYYSPVELSKNRLVPKQNGLVRTFTF